MVKNRGCEKIEMVFVGYGKYERRKRKMPFVRINNNTNGFIWRYRPREEVNLQVIKNTRMLIITTDYVEPGFICKVPSLEIFNETGTLEHLEIWDLDVSHLPKIPDSVRTLELRDTNLTNLNQICANWGNIETLVLDSNKKFTGSVIVPEGVRDFAIMNQLVGVIRFPADIRKVRCGPMVRFTQLTGNMPREMLYLVNVISNPYKKGLDAMERLCENEIRGSLPMYEDIITQKWHIQQMKFIESVNKNINYSLCSDMGSIPTRIRVSEDNVENPIVVAMNLSSNYPRRMAEFFTEVTTVI